MVIQYILTYKHTNGLLLQNATQLRVHAKNLIIKNSQSTMPGAKDFIIKSD